MRFRQSPDENAAVWFIVIGSTLSLICLSWWISGNRSYRKGWNDAYSSFKPDTVYRDTTIYDIKPVPVEVTPAGKEMHPVGTVAQLKKVIDSLAAVKPDTTLIEIPVPLETKVYRDEKDSTYEAKVTGYKASLDWVKVNQKTAYINVPIPTPDPRVAYVHRFSGTQCGDTAAQRLRRGWCRGGLLVWEASNIP